MVSHGMVGKVLKRQGTGFNTVDTCYSLCLSLSVSLNEAKLNRVIVKFLSAALSGTDLLDISPDVIKNRTSPRTGRISMDYRIDGIDGSGRIVAFVSASRLASRSRWATLEEENGDRE